MKEGVDVGLEMAGNPDAFRDMRGNMCHGGKIAMLGIPSEDISIDWNHVVFNMLTIKGIYGREMYETWYKMTVMLQAGLDLQPVITHRFHFTEWEKGFEVMNSGKSGKVLLHWGQELPSGSELDQASEGEGEGGVEQGGRRRRRCRSATTRRTRWR